VLHPAQPLQPEFMHSAQEVYVGVPEQVGPVSNTCGGTCAAVISAVPQQIRACPEQSLSDLHGLGQVIWHTPLQQSSPVAAQSLELVQDFGQGAYIGLRQRAEALRLGSMLLTEVQQTSPMLVWQSELVVQVFGHSLDGRQIP
jgi:hypothetical protein